MKKYSSLLMLFIVSFSMLAQTKEYSIGVLIDNHTPKIDVLLDQFRTEVKAVVGEDAMITFKSENLLVNYYNLDKAKAQYKQLISGESDIVIAFGPINSQVIYNQKKYPKPTILFGSVNTDLFGFDFKEKTSGIPNFTYLVQSKSFKNDIVTFKELTGFQKVGVAVVSPLSKYLHKDSKFSKEMFDLGINYKLIPFHNTSDIIDNLNDIDAFYMAGGFFLSEKEIKQLADVFIRKKIPTFTTNGREDISQGFMATNQSENGMSELIRRVAISIMAHINGTNLSVLPTYVDQTKRLAINYNTALSVGVPLKYSFIGKTDFVGEFLNPVSEKQYNLLMAIDDALKENLSLKSSEKNIQFSSQEVKNAKSDYLPNLTASANGIYVDPDFANVSFGRNPEFSTNGNLTFEQLLFSETVNANIHIKRKLEKAQQELFRSEELDIVLETSNAYFTALILKVNVRLQMQNLSLTKSNLQIAKQNFELGQSGKSDVVRLESELAQNTQATIEAVNQLEQAFLFLKQVMNKPLGTAIDVEDIGLEKGIFEQYKYAEIIELLDNPNLRETFIGFLIEEGHKTAPELKSLGFNKQAFERSIKLNGSGRFLPTLALQGQYNRIFSRSGAGVLPPQGFEQLDSYYNVGLSLNIPIFNQNKINLNRNKSIIQREQLEINLENTKLSISANIRNSVLDLANQVSNIKLSKVSEQSALESLNLVNDAYASGAVTIVQLLDAQRNYLSSQLASASASYQFLLSSLKLERTLGSYFLLNSNDKNETFKQRFFEYLKNKN